MFQQVQQESYQSSFRASNLLLSIIWVCAHHAVLFYELN